MKSKIVTNLVAMPKVLMLLTLGAVIVVAFVIRTLVPDDSINAFGREISTSDWWSSGAGAVGLMVGLTLSVAAVMMLRRASGGRLVYVTGWVGISVSAPIIAKLTGTNSSAQLPPLIANLAITIGIFIYLYVSKDVRSYFGEV